MRWSNSDRHKFLMLKNTRKSEQTFKKQRAFIHVEASHKEKYIPRCLHRWILPNVWKLMDSSPSQTLPKREETFSEAVSILHWN